MGRFSFTTTYDPRKIKSNVFGYEQPPRRSDKWHRVFCCYFHFVAWDCLSLGFHVSLLLPNIEVHLPFGFIRIGWLMMPPRKDMDYASHL